MKLFEQLRSSKSEVRQVQITNFAWLPPMAAVHYSKQQTRCHERRGTLYQKGGLLHEREYIMVLFWQLYLTQNPIFIVFKRGLRSISIPF